MLQLMQIVKNYVMRLQSAKLGPGWAVIYFVTQKVDKVGLPRASQNIILDSKMQHLLSNRILISKEEAIANENNKI